MKFFAYFLAALLFFGNVTLASAAFSDTEASWYRDSITELNAQGIINGFDNGTFRPRQKVTRAEMLKIAMNIGDKKILENTSDSCFPDVEEYAWYSEYICSAQQQGIANGHIDGLFRPNGPVTYHEAIAFLTRTLEIQVGEQDTDIHWYDAYQEYAESNAIAPANKYDVTTHILRGQVTELAKNFQLHEQGGDISYKTNGCGIQPGGDLSPILVSGKDRTFLMYVPSDYDSQKTYSLIVAAHGRTNSNTRVKGYMGLEGKRQWQNNRWQENSQDDFIVVYPAGLSNGSSFSWHQPENIAFFDHLISEMADNYCLDRRQIFMVGHSLGGYFTNKVSCLRGDVLRGMGVIGSTPYSGICSGPVASAIFHHPNDSLVSYASGERARNNKINNNTCSQDTVPRSIAGYSCNEYQQCRTGNQVAWCDSYSDTYGGDPHSWPRNAGNAFLEFFRSLE